MAERASSGCVGSDRRCVANPPAREPDTGGGITATWFELSVFRLKACACPFEQLCSSVASGFYYLSSDGLCAVPYDDVRTLFRGDALDRDTGAQGLFSRGVLDSLSENESPSLEHSVEIGTTSHLPDSLHFSLRLVLLLIPRAYLF